MMFGVKTTRDDETETLTQAGDKLDLGQYQVQALLGRGGMGEVYRAHDPELARDVAIKILSGEAGSDSKQVSRLRCEARVLASLNHPNIAAIYGLDESAGLNFLILELVEGETLAERLRRTGPMTVPESIAVMSQVADALEAAHLKGVVHRDIKPANIKITPDGRVKVLDFGLAKVLAPGAAAQRDSTGADLQPRRVTGTPRYMSPEQARGMNVDRRTDIWSFGCVLYELLSGEPAHPGETISDIFAVILTGEPDYNALPPTIPGRLRFLIQQCLAKDADQRLPDIAAVRRQIAVLHEDSHRRTLTRRRLLTAAAAAAVSAPALFDVRGLSWHKPPIPSIAVLPLANLSGRADQDYFSDGITESLITHLAKIGALKVISRTSVMTYKGTEKPLRTIAKELKVDTILIGSAALFGDRVRVTMQLIDAATERHLWANSYDRNFSQILLLQNEIARTVAEQVRAQLTTEERRRLSSARAVNPAAHEAYLKGKFHAYRTTREGLDTAEQYFELALVQDPGYALGYTGIARVWGGRQHTGLVPSEVAGPKLLAAAEKALALDDSLAEIHFILACVKTWTFWDFRAAEAAFRRAISLDPNYPETRALYARLLNMLQRPAEAMPQIERALELDPYNAFFRAMYAGDLCWVRKYDEAIEHARRALAAAPDQLIAQKALQIAFSAKGMLKQAIEVEIARTTARGDVEIAGVLRRSHGQGRYREAAKSAADLLQQRSLNRAFVPPAEIAAFYLMAGLADNTLDWLEKAVEQRDPNVLGARLIAAGLPGLESNPRFQAILRRIGLP